MGSTPGVAPGHLDGQHHLCYTEEDCVCWGHQTYILTLPALSSWQQPCPVVPVSATPQLLCVLAQQQLHASG